jgi:hypothetical protein
MRAARAVRPGAARRGLASPRLVLSMGRPSAIASSSNLLRFRILCDKAHGVSELLRASFVNYCLQLLCVSSTSLHQVMSQMIVETEGRRNEATPLTSPMCHSPHVV